MSKKKATVSQVNVCHTIVAQCLLAPLLTQVDSFDISDCFWGASPNLHFHTLPGTQIYTTHIYTEPIVTRHQIYTGPKFTRTHIFTTSNLHNPILHKPKYTQPQNNTKPNFTQTKFTQVPILHNQGMFIFSTKI